MEHEDIFIAARQNDLQLATRLLDKTPELINALNHNGQTALFIASYLGNKAFVEFLINHSAFDDFDVFSTDKWGRDAYDAAIQCRNTEIARLLQPIFENPSNIPNEIEFHRSNAIGIITVIIDNITEFFHNVEFGWRSFAVGSVVASSLFIFGTIAFKSSWLPDQKFAQEDSSGLNDKKGEIIAAESVGEAVKRLRIIQSSLQSNGITITKISRVQSVTPDDLSAISEQCQIYVSAKNMILKYEIPNNHSEKTWVDVKTNSLILETNIFPKQEKNLSDLKDAVKAICFI